MTLKEFFNEHTRVALAFSGGTDSAYLLHAAIVCGAQVRPYFIKTLFQPRFELEDALHVGRQLGVEITVLEAYLLDNPAIASNPSNRCYHCKRALFSLLRQRALEDGYTELLDGSNASDDEDDRPGMRALRELGVYSPLRLCGLDKAEIRERSKQVGLSTWNRPAYACLATRIPAGRTLDAALLARVEGAEEAMRQLGFIDFRIRVFYDAARIQLRADQMPLALERRAELLSCVGAYFDPVLLDLRGR